MQETQGVASLALGYVLLWAFIGIIGCGSAIQASLIAFALHGDSNRTRLNSKLEKLSFLCKDSANRAHKVKLA